jgi:predicted dehydrogenase
MSEKKINVGLVGMGLFGRSFVQLFTKSPLCGEVALCEVREDVLNEISDEHEIPSDRRFQDFDEMLKSNIDAVAIYTQRWSHAPLALKALRAGKHVYSAVPAAVTLEEMEELVKTVEETGLTYALGETSFYRGQNIWCRRKFAQGDFGNFVYGEGHYYHDMSHWFYWPFLDANGPDWKKYASVPPIWYPTHSVCHVLGVTFSKFTHATCYGWEDRPHPDGIFNKELSAFDNPWSNQTALFRTGDGGMARINEFRRTGAGECRQTIIGDKGSYMEQPNPETVHISVQEQIEGKEKQGAGIPQSRAVFSHHYYTKPPFTEDGEFDPEEAQRQAKKVNEDVSWIMAYKGVEITEDRLGNLPREFLGKKHLGVCELHEVERLPGEYVGLRNGHCGSHHFIIHDFLEAIDTGKLPPNHVWLAARFNNPGVVAHESCKREGERLPIPDFGKPPADKECLDPLVVLRD